MFDEGVWFGIGKSEGQEDKIVYQQQSRRSLLKLMRSNAFVIKACLRRLTVGVKVSRKS